MTISYVLHENNLTSDPNDYTANINYKGAVDLEGVIERMIDHGSTVTKADALAVLQEYFAAVDSLVLEGFKVLTPGANYGVSIKGIFHGPDDTFDSSRHSIEATVSNGAQFRKTIRENAQPKKEEAVKPSPNVVAYFDISSNESNALLTPGGMGKISGHRLKFDLADTQQGIFFIKGDSATRVQTVGHNKPAELMFIVPAGLSPGDYTLEVRALFGKNDIRIGLLDKTLTVA